MSTHPGAWHPGPLPGQAAIPSFVAEWVAGYKAPPRQRGRVRAGASQAG